jgi:hypothetical protein
MAGAKLEKTRWPGIYRRGTRWVYAWTDATGNARRGTADTREEASRLKAEEEQRAIRRDIERYWLPPLGRRPLADITTPALGRVIGDLAARDGDSYLADRTLRRLFAPMAALMATAVDEGFIPHNPARDVTLPSGRDALRRFDPDADEDTDDPSPGKARSLTGEQLGAFLLVTDDRWRRCSSCSPLPACGSARRSRCGGGIFGSTATVPPSAFAEPVSRVTTDRELARQPRSASPLRARARSPRAAQRVRVA